jgi:hypothetical protein
MLIASMDIEPEKEDLFNEVYDTEHIPGILRVPGVVSVEAGRWPNEVRPFTSNRQFALRKVID